MFLVAEKILYHCNAFGLQERIVGGNVCSLITNIVHAYAASSTVAAAGGARMQMVRGEIIRHVAAAAAASANVVYVCHTWIVDILLLSRGIA